TVYEAVGGHEETEPPTNVYVSRDKASRKIANEEEVMAALTGEGFKKFFLEDLTVAEQIRAFAGADIVVAPHGAGNTNIIHSRHAALVELLPVGHPGFTGNYRKTTRTLDIPYYSMDCPQTADQPARYHVDIDQMMALVRQARRDKSQAAAATENAPE
ncbi:MAG: glycosyltransferase family 61 protein, partial [Caulobacterales bacterium]|nr:glycosyltransferase family 61 protein [Caulobacterales bacterium]